MKKLFFRTGLAAGTVGLVLAGAALFAAFEAHVVNVTATIAEATDISTEALTYGTVFPQEILHQPVTLSLSSSFITSQATGVDYVIKQKPKCGLPVPTDSTSTIVSYSAYGLVTENSDGIFSCVDANYVMLPLLCPYLSKTSPDTADTSVPSFHGPIALADWTDAVSVQTQAVGHLTQVDPSTTWDIDLHVPCFKGQCAQDWANFVHTANASATPANYMADPAFEHQQMGCDLWYELTNVTRGGGPTVNNVTVGPNDLESVLANSATSHKWYFYDDTADVLNNSLGTFVAGPGSPPYGTGSAQVTLADASSRVFLANSGFGGTTLASITQLGYGEYSHSGVGGANEAPFVRFNVDFSGAAGYQNSLVYVPSTNGSITKDVWQSWDLISGGTATWSYSGANWPAATAGPDFGGPVTPGTTLRTWTQILADYPSIRMHPLFPQVGVRVGEPGPTGYIGNVDFFKIATGGIPTVYDFDN